MTDEPPAPFIREDEVAAFWDQARAKADTQLQTGYLQDEWPAALGWNRFAGETRQVEAWLKKYAVPRRTFLDIGCGTGAWLERFAPSFEHAAGIDSSEAMIASARARLPASVDLAVKSVTDLGEGHTDFIFVGGVLMYLEDEAAEEAIAGFARRLDDKGLLILRESTSPRGTWRRDTPLSPGLFADRSKARAPYRAIYRDVRDYRTWAERHGLRVLACQRNRNYDIANLTESWLSASNRLRGGKLARDRAAADRSAQWIHRLRHALTVPWAYALPARHWKITNHWLLCARR